MIFLLRTLVQGGKKERENENNSVVVYLEDERSVVVEVVTPHQVFHQF